MLTILIVLAVMSALGGWYLKAGRASTLDRLKREADDKLLALLGEAAADLDGEVVDGSSLQTRHGRVTLTATRAPVSTVIDLIRFIATVPGSRTLTVVAKADAKKVTATKSLRPVAIEDPDVAADFALLSSDEIWARSALTPAVTGRLRELNRDLRVPVRLQAAAGKVVLLVSRGISRPEEIRVFHEGCAAVVDALRPHFES